MNAADPLIRLEHVSVAYPGGQPVIEDIDLTIATGQFIGVVGPSGAGKTTLLRTIMGTVRATSGDVRRQRGLAIGYVPQVETVDWQFPVTVAECVLMARTSGRVLPWASPAERRDVTEILDRLGIGAFADRHIRRLSGGQQQRVFIARALLRRPDVLLMDEPSSGVDVHTRHEILHLLDGLHRDGTTIVLTTHDLNGVAAHLPWLVCLNRTVIGAGLPRDVLTPAVLETTYGATLEVLEHGGMPVVVDPARQAAHPGRGVAS